MATAACLNRPLPTRIHPLGKIFRIRQLHRTTEGTEGRSAAPIRQLIAPAKGTHIQIIRGRMLQFTELHRSRLKSLNPCSRTRRKTSRSVFHFPRRTIAAVGPGNGSRGCRYGGHSKRLGHPAKLQSIKSYRRRPFGSEFLTTKGTNIGLVGRSEEHTS